MININNSKKSTKSSAEHCNSKQVRILQNVGEIVFLSSQIYLQASFILPNVLVLPVLVLKLNKTSYVEYFLAKIFVSLLKLLNISLDKWSFFKSYKIRFFNDYSKWTKKTLLTLVSMMIINELFRETASIQLCKLIFEERVELI